MQEYIDNETIEKRYTNYEETVGVANSTLTVIDLDNSPNYIIPVSRNQIVWLKGGTPPGEIDIALPMGNIHNGDTVKILALAGSDLDLHTQKNLDKPDDKDGVIISNISSALIVTSTGETPTIGYSELKVTNDATVATEAYSLVSVTLVCVDNGTPTTHATWIITDISYVLS